MKANAIKKIIIAGGGTAGWMTAAAITKLLGKNLEVTLIESDEIGTVGVGEATIPTLLTFHKMLAINEQEFLSAVGGTFKLGISFENWLNMGEKYIHSFGNAGADCWACGFQHFWLRGKQEGKALDYAHYSLETQASLAGRFAHLPNNKMNYAYHFDASLYAKFLRGIAEEYGIKRVEGKISSVQLNDASGFIESITLESGNIIDGDLFIDCTGFRALLIEGALHTGFEDWSHYLPCDSAVAVQTYKVAPPVPYTRAIAHASGWQWKIALQHRVGNGLVYCSRYLSDDAAKKLLLENVEGETLFEPRVIKYRPGQRRKYWNKNCISVGLSSGFIEPLESTSIHLIQRAIVRLLQNFPQHDIVQKDADEFNKQMSAEVMNIRDFIILHYNATQRTDSPFWRYCKDMAIPESLKHRMDLFRETGRVFFAAFELFGENSWVQVMMGQGIVPKQYHPIVDMMTDKEMEVFLNGVVNNVDNLVRQMPGQEEYLKHYCPQKV